MSLLATSRWRFNRHLNDVYIKRLCHIGSLVSSESCWNGLGSRKSVVEMSTMTLLSTSLFASFCRFWSGRRGDKLQVHSNLSCKNVLLLLFKIHFFPNSWMVVARSCCSSSSSGRRVWAQTKKHLSWTTEKDKLRGMIGDSDKEDEKLSGSG